VASEKFLGRYSHNLDDKGRVAIPHKFRTILGGANENRVIVTLSTNPTYAYLDLYPSVEWDAILDRILAMRFEGDEAHQNEMREGLLANYVHPAQEVELDRQGRILVPQEHRDFASIDKEVVFTGDGRKFRLWSRPEWARYEEAMRKLRPVLPPIPQATS